MVGFPGFPSISSLRFTFTLYFVVSGKHISCSDMDISNGSHTDHDNHNSMWHLPQKTVPKLKESPKSNGQRAKEDINTSIPQAIMPECISFHQHAIDVAIMNLVLEYLEKSNLDPNQLTDDQLKLHIKYIIDVEYYKKNLRSESVESQLSVESTHSR